MRGRQFVILSLALVTVLTVFGCGSGYTPGNSAFGITLSTDSLAFPDIAIGKASAARLVTVTGSGIFPLQHMTVSLGDTRNYSMSSGCGASLGPHATCVVSVVFRPQTTGTFPAFLTFADNSVGKEPIQQSVALKAAGVLPPNPQATLSAGSVTFPSTRVGGSAGRQSVTLTNTGTSSLSLGNITIGAANSRSEYVAIGDSITTGAFAAAPAIESFPVLVASSTGALLNVQARSGMMACDELVSVILPNGISSHVRDAKFYTNMIGTNDVDLKGTGPYEHVFQTCHQATLAWLSTPREAMVLAGDPGMTGASGWNPAPDAAHFKAAFAASTGTLTTVLTTYGAPIYGWYELDDAAPANSCFSLAIDSAPTVSKFCTLLSTNIDTVNGNTRAIGFIRLATAAGTHTLVASTGTGGVALLGFGTLPAATADLPLVLSADVPNQISSTRAAAILSYNVDVLTDEALLRADGAGILHVPDDMYMLGTPAEMADEVHPSTLGHRHLADAYLSVFPATGNALAAFTKTTDCAGALAPGNACHIDVSFSPSQASTAYTATLTITDDSGDIAGSTQTVVLKGLGTAN